MINLVWLPGIFSAAVVTLGMFNLFRLVGRVAHGDIRPDLSERDDLFAQKQEDFHKAWSDGGAYHRFSRRHGGAKTW